MPKRSIESASSDFSAESEQRMLNLLLFCEFYLTFYQKQMVNSVKNRTFARIYHEACKDLAVNNRSFCKKSDDFQCLMRKRVSSHLYLLIEKPGYMVF